MKLNLKIIIFTLEVALIPLLFLGFIVYSNDEVQLDQNTLKEVDAIAQIQKNRLQDVLSQKQDLLSLFVTKPLLRSYLRAYNESPTLLLQKNMNDNLSEAMGGSNMIEEIFVTNTHGVTVAATDPSFIGLDVSAQDYFKQGIKSSYLSFLNKDSSGSLDQYLAEPLSLDGKIEGMVVLVTNADDITNLANDYTGLGNTGETLLVTDDGNGNALFLTPVRFDQNAALMRVVSKDRKDIASVHAIEGEEGAFNNLVDYRDIPVFAATRYVKSVNWGIVVKIDQSEALAPVVRLRDLYLLIIFGAGILIILLTIPIANFVVVREKELDKEKDEFISLASHQLRTPITAISWNLESLLGGDKGQLNDEQKKSLQEIHESSKNMADLVSGFLDVTKIESGGFAVERGSVDLVQTSESILKDLSNQISDKKINIIKKYADDLPHSDIGVKTARIILQNLFTNAVKYTQEGGNVEIKIEKSSNGFLISVKDNGYGIPEKDKKKIFMKLFRADNVKEKEPTGTGLGLYLVKSLINKLGGRIWFESKEGSGTTFYVNLK